MGVLDQILADYAGEMPEHSPVGGSSRYRWRREACPGSVALVHREGAVQEDTAFTTFGNVCHELVADRLRFKFWTRALTEREARVCEPYVAYVEGRVAEWSAQGRVTLEVERRFQHPAHVLAWGTPDAVITTRRRNGSVWVEIIDFKTGSGLWVDHENNPQLLSYWAGKATAIRDCVQLLFLTIVQPPFPDEVTGSCVRTQQLSEFDAMRAAADYVEDVKAVDESLAPLRTGPWCNWCPAVGACPQVKHEAEQTALTVFAAPEAELPGEQIGKILEAWPRIEARVKALRAEAYRRAYAGERVPGMKLVNGKRQRRVTVPEHVLARKVLDSGRSLTAMYKAKMLSAKQLLTLLGPESMKSCWEWVDTPYVLALETDRRKEVTPDPTKVFAIPTDETEDTDETEE